MTCITKAFQIVDSIDNHSDLEREKITHDFSKFTVNSKPDYNAFSLFSVHTEASGSII